MNPEKNPQETTMETTETTPALETTESHRYTTPGGEDVLAPVVERPVKILDVELTAEQRFERAIVARTESKEASRLEAEAKVKAQEYKTLIAATEGRCTAALEAAASGHELQSVNCLERLDWGARKMRTVRLDTGEEIDARALDESVLKSHLELTPDFERGLMVATCKHSGEEIRSFTRRLTDAEKQQELALTVRVWIAEADWDRITEDDKLAGLFTEVKGQDVTWDGTAGAVFADVNEATAVELERLGKIHEVKVLRGQGDTLPTGTAAPTAPTDDELPFDAPAKVHQLDPAAKKERGGKKRGRTAEATG